MAGALDKVPLANGGFERPLAPAEWNFLRDGPDWNGFDVIATTSHIEIDPTTAAEGRSSLKVWSVGAATLVSAPVPGQGGEWRLCGQTRTEALKPGRFPEYGGAVQLVGLDQDGNIIAHQDAKLLSGTRPWEPFACRAAFPATVKQVQVWIRLFQGATGTFWVDGLTLDPIPHPGIAGTKTNYELSPAEAQRRGEK
ncbi:MAG: hypothetical protein WC708_04135 [Lentisphaeria bacterium]